MRGQKDVDEISREIEFRDYQIMCVFFHTENEGEEPMRSVEERGLIKC